MSTWDDMKKEFNASFTKEEREAVAIKVKNFGMKLKYWSDEDLKTVLIGTGYEIDDAIGAIIEATTTEDAERAGLYYAEFKRDRKRLKREIKRRERKELKKRISDVKTKPGEFVDSDEVFKNID